jgi:hypothetical protein
MRCGVRYRYRVVGLRNIIFIDQDGIDVYSREGLVGRVDKFRLARTEN